MPSINNSNENENDLNSLKICYGKQIWEFYYMETNKIYVSRELELFWIDRREKQQRVSVFAAFALIFLTVILRVKYYNYIKFPTKIC